MFRIFSFHFCLTTVFLFLSLSAKAQVFNAVGGPISDNGQPNYYPIEVSGLNQAVLDTAHGLVKVCLDITHTWDSDLDVQLISPNGTAITLFSGIGGNGHNFTNTCLSETATNSILNSSAPFTGNFQPLDVLGNMNNGQEGNGTWSLRILDTYPGADTGELLGFSLTFGPHAGMPLGIDSSNLPIVKIETNGQAIVDEPKITADLKIIHNGNGLMNFPGDSANGYSGKIGIEIRGSFSASLPQKPFGFETRNADGTNRNVSLLGMPSENDWILNATYNDKTFIRNSLAYEIFRKMGRYASRSQLCEVSINGSYRGIYLLMEKLKRDSKRINISKLDSAANSGDDLTGGYILKVDYHNPSNSWLSSYSPLNHPSYPVYYVYDYPSSDVITNLQKTYIQGFMYALESALYGPDFKNPVSGYRAYLDVPSFIDYLIVNELSRNNDGFKKSYYFHKDKNSKGGLLKSGPVWDFDWAWKNINECSIFAATNGSGWAYNVNNCNPDNKSPGWMIRLLQDSSFTNQLKCRYTQLRSTVLDTNVLFQYVDSVQNLVNMAQARHYKKWPILKLNVGTPEVGTQPTTYAGHMNRLKAWIRLRLKWLDQNMPGSCAQTEIKQSLKETIVRVFPNPAENELFIESEKSIVSTQLVDVTGRKVKDIFPDPTRIRYDVSGFSPGIYILKCRLENGEMIFKKIQKQ